MINNVFREGQELVARLNSDPDEFAGYNDLLSLFFKGLPIPVLRELVQRSNSRVISGALFIAEELGDKASVLLDDIAKHAQNGNAKIRNAALKAIGACSSPEHGDAFLALVHGLRDSDVRCRKTAMLWMMWVPETLLKTALAAVDRDGDAELKAGLSLLLSEESKNPRQIEAWLVESNQLTRRFGVIAAGRVSSQHPQLLHIAATSEDVDLQLAASAQLHFAELRQQQRSR